MMNVDVEEHNLKIDILPNSETYVFKPYRFNLVVPDSSSPAPEARSGHRITCTMKNLYVVGGYNPSSTEDSMVYREMWKLNFATLKWTRYAKDVTFPKELVSFAVVRKGLQLLVYGGTGIPFGLANSNRLYCMKLNGDNHVLLKARIVGKRPKRVYGHAIVLHKQFLYVIGGTCGFSFNCDVHRLNLAREPKRWRVLFKSRSPGVADEIIRYEPEGRYRHEVGFNGRNIYMIGGGTAMSSFDLTEIPVFSITAKKWRRRMAKPDLNSDPPYPPARRCHGSVQLTDDNGRHYVFIMGGYEHCMQVYNDLWRLELSTLQWKRLCCSGLPAALYFHSTAVTKEGKMFVFGGIKEGMALQRTNDVYCTWLCIPKLYEICWEAVLHYYRPSGISKDLIKRVLKVPKRFSDRVD